MLCQNCKKRIADVHFTQIINNKKIEMYLCEQCASEKGQVSFTLPLNLNKFLSGFVGADAESYINTAPKAMVCKKCGMSFDEFQRTGKLGCGECYKTYGERLKSVLKRLHGNVEHSGKVPAKLSKSLSTSKEVERLKELLNKAVQCEEYEKAADIRDRIKAIESAM